MLLLANDYFVSDKVGSDPCGRLADHQVIPPYPGNPGYLLYGLSWYVIKN